MRALIARVTAQSASLAAVLMIAGIGLYAWWDHQAAVGAEQDRAIELVVTMLSVTVEQDALRTTVSRASPSGQLAVHLADGRHVGASRASSTEVDAARRVGPRTVDIGPGRSLLRPVPAADGSTAVIELYRPDREVNTAIAQVGAVTGVFGLVGVVAVGLAIASADRLMAPAVYQLRSLAATALGHRHTELDPQPTRTGVTELAAVATLIDKASELTTTLLARQQKMILDVSHRLRTPLTALRLDADAIGEGPIAERIRSAVVALEQDVDNIIRTAGQPPEPIEPSNTTCDVSDTVRRRMEFWQLLATTQHRPCDISYPHEPTPVALSEKNVGEIVDTLIHNVFRHTEPGTPLAVTVGRHNGWISLVVDDGGAGITDPDAALRRGVSGGGSTGLGLDIARTGVEATGGTIHIERGKLGGARIRLRFAEAGSLHHEQPKAWRLWSDRPDQ